MRLARAASVLVAGAALLTAWIASAPPASNPDGVFHLVSIWCAEGTNDTDCVPIPDDPERVLVPRSIQQAACYAYEPLETAACAQQFMSATIDVLAPSARGNLGGERPQLYYRFMHRFQGGDVLASVTTMRAVNAGIGLALISLTSLLAGPAVRRGLHASWLLTGVPLGVWLLSTTNTGAWMVAGLGTAWANGLTALDRDAGAWRRASAGALATLGAIMALGARTEAAVPLLAAAAAIVVLRAPSPGMLLRSGRDGAGRRQLLSGLVAASAVIALALLLLPQTAAVEAPITELAAGLEELRARGAGNPLLHLTLTVPSLLMGGLGVGWGLGWVDTLVPVPVGGIVLGAWSAVLARTFVGMRRRQIAAVGILGVVAVAFPVFTLAYYGLYVGEQFQPRHYVILLFMTIGFAALGGRDRLRLITGGQRIALVVFLALAHAHLLHQNTRRYVTGLRSEVFLNLARDAEWWWLTYPVGPTANWLIGSVAFGVVAWTLSRSLSEDSAIGGGAPSAGSGRTARLRRARP